MSSEMRELVEALAGKWERIAAERGVVQFTGNDHLLFANELRALLARTEAGADGAAMLVRDVCEMAPADPDAPDTVCIRVSDLTRIAEQYTHPQDASGDAVAELIAAADVLNTGAKNGLSTYPEDWKRLDAALDAMQAKEAK